MGGAATNDSRRNALVANIGIGALGLLCLVASVRMGPAWQWAHFLPNWGWSWSIQAKILLVLRVLVALVGAIVLVLLRPWLVRAIGTGRGHQTLVSALAALLAVAAACAVTEGILHTRAWRSVQERWDQEPQRVANAEYGWAFKPDHAGTVILNGHPVHYATGPFGYRAPRPGVAPNFERPTIVFAGESIIFGYGLDWPDTVPAQVEAMTGIQGANIAVNAHATDQILLRLRRELPRFGHPIAVVVPFMPRLFDRNLDQDRPHLDGQLRWHPAEPPPWRLLELARRVVRYRSAAAIRDGTLMTQRALHSAIALARARGAAPLVVVPQFLPEEPREAAIRRAVLDAAGIPYLLVPIKPEWISPGHHHPTARGSLAIARAITAALPPAAAG